jgi:hypothetical protein
VRVEIGKYYRVNSDMFCFNLDEAMFPKTKEEFEDIEFLGFFQVVTTTSNILKMIKNLTNHLDNIKGLKAGQRIKVDNLERNEDDVITYIVMIDIVTGEEYSWSSILENKLTEIN